MSYLLQACSTVKDLIKVCILSLPVLIWCSFNIIICDMSRKYWSYTKLDVNCAMMKMAELILRTQPNSTIKSTLKGFSTCVRKDSSHNITWVGPN